MDRLMIFALVILSTYSSSEIIGSGSSGVIVPPIDQVSVLTNDHFNSNPCGIDNWVQTPFQTCVKVINNAPITWSDARQQCQGFGGDMVMMTDGNKASWYAQFLGQHHRGKAYWLGARYEQQGPRGKGFYWQSSKGPIPFTFSAFSQGEPNLLYMQRNAQPCLLIGANLMWYDDPCTMRHPDVGTMCEKSLAGSTPTNPVNQWGGSNPVNSGNRWGGSNPVNSGNQWGGSNPVNSGNQLGGSNPTNPVNPWG